MASKVKQMGTMQLPVKNQKQHEPIRKGWRDKIVKKEKQVEEDKNE